MDFENLKFADGLRKCLDERVKPVSFMELLKEDGEDAPPPADDAPADDAPPADDGGFDDAGGDAGFDDAGGDAGGFDDAGGDAGGFGGGGDGGFGGGPSGGSSEGGSEETDDKEDKGDDKFKDREDDPDFTRGLPDPTLSPANSGPAGAGIYDTEGVLAKLNQVIETNEIDLTEIDSAQNVLEVIANGKKLIDDDFKNITNNRSFSDIVKRALESVDDRTRNYFSFKIKDAILKIQRSKKIDANKAKGDVEQTRDLVGSF